MYSPMIQLIYYGFVCDHFLRNMYWGLVSVLAGLCALSTMHPRFHTVKAKAIRGALYSAFGASSFAPIIHAVDKYGWEVQKDRMGLVWYAYVALFNSIGVLAYALRVSLGFCGTKNPPKTLHFSMRHFYLLLISTFYGRFLNDFFPENLTSWARATRYYMCLS